MIWKDRNSNIIYKITKGKKQWFGNSIEDYESHKKEIKEFLEMNPETKIWGGSAFNIEGSLKDNRWKNIPRYYYFIAEKVEEISLNEENEINTDILKEEHSLTRTEWEKRVLEIQREIKNKNIEKAVISRKTEVIHNESLNSINMLKELLRKFPNCYIYSLELRDGTAFIGASPERLFSKNSNKIETEALAGTRKRGLNFNEDLKLETNLIKSKKDREEHKIVVEHVLDHCREMCQDIKQSSTKVLKFTNVQHLYMKVEGELSNSTDTLEILSTFHPTPAVCGSPTQNAKQIIEKVETHDRGWYGGTIGWFTKDKAEIAVSIRSGLLTKNRFTYYTGVGIVEKSEAIKEWEELNYKAAAFKKKKEYTNEISKV